MADAAGQLGRALRVGAERVALAFEAGDDLLELLSLIPVDQRCDGVLHKGAQFAWRDGNAGGTPRLYSLFPDRRVSEISHSTCSRS